MKRAFSIVFASILAISVFVLTGCSSADPIVGEWEVCSIIDGDETKDPIGMAEFTFLFGKDNTGKMSTPDGGYISFVWTYSDRVEEGVRFYDLSYEDGSSAAALVAPDGDTICIPVEQDYYFVFEKAG